MPQRIAIITGASQGVGKAVAYHLAEKNYTVILLARNEQALTQICAELLEKNKKAYFYVVDVSDSRQVDLCIQKIIDKHGKIDLLFNNAAILQRGTTSVSDPDIDKLLSINLNGAIYVAKYVALQMKKQKSGYIMNMSSLGGKNAASFAGIYAASKFGLSGFSEALTKEMAAYSVKVTNICPSMIATEMAKGRKFNAEEIIQVKDILHTIDYLLELSFFAIPTEITISCLSLIEKTTEAMCKLYLD